MIKKKTKKQSCVSHVRYLLIATPMWLMISPRGPPRGSYSGSATDHSAQTDSCKMWHSCTVGIFPPFQLPSRIPLSDRKWQTTVTEWRLRSFIRSRCVGPWQDARRKRPSGPTVHLHSWQTSAGVDKRVQEWAAETMGAPGQLVSYPASASATTSWNLWNVCEPATSSHQLWEVRRCWQRGACESQQLVATPLPSKSKSFPWPQFIFNYLGKPFSLKLVTLLCIYAHM